MTENETDYVVRIGPEDRYRHLHVRRHGKITFFRLQYETKVKDDWFPVVRYDTAHGFVHRDLMNYNGIVISKTPLFNQDYNDALTFAENDLKLNWDYYKKRFLEG